MVRSNRPSADQGRGMSPRLSRVEFDEMEGSKASMGLQRSRRDCSERAEGDCASGSVWFVLDCG